MFATDLYNFFTDANTYSAAGINVYDAIWGVITWHPEISEITKIEKTDLESGETELLKPEIIKAINVDIIQKDLEMPLLKGLKNVGGFSCFMDSLIFPLLIIDGYFHEKLLKGKVECPHIKNALQKIYQNITDTTEDLTCVPLINAMKQCKESIRFATGQQQDDSEFLIALMSIYSLTPTVVNNRIYLSNDKKNWININNTDVKQAVLEIEPKLEEPLQIYQKANLEDYMDDPENMPKDDNGNKYRYKYSADRILSSDALILHIKRRFLGKKDTTPVIITKTIKDSSKDIYYDLKVITIHHGGFSGGHYTSFFHWGNDWYYYDDLKNQIKQVDWEFVKEMGSKNGSVLIYYPV